MILAECQRAIDEDKSGAIVLGCAGMADLARFIEDRLHSVVFTPRNGKPRVDKAQERISALEAKLRRKDEVLGELMEEHVALKKELGEL